MKTKEQTIQDLLKLWQNPDFSGSFSSLKTFKTALFSEKAMKVPNAYLLEMFKRIPQFVATKRRSKPNEFRKYIIEGTFEAFFGSIFFVMIKPLILGGNRKIAEVDIYEFPKNSYAPYGILCIGCLENILMSVFWLLLVLLFSQLLGHPVVKIRMISKLLF